MKVKIIKNFFEKIKDSIEKHEELFIFTPMNFLRTVLFELYGDKWSIIKEYNTSEISKVIEEGKLPKEMI